MRKNSYFIFISFFLFLKAYSNPSEQFFLQHLDNGNGLSNSAINYIFKDSDNIIWVATWDGLNMYDGTSFHVFNYGKEQGSKSIGSNVIQRITEDKGGNIWINTIEGISRYDKHSGIFYNYFYNQHQRSKISEQEYELAVDKTGDVFCLTQKYGLIYYDAAADAFRHCNLPKRPAKFNKLAFDEFDHLWLLNNNGDFEMYSRGKQHEFKLLHTYQEKRGIVNFFHVNKHLFFSTTDGQLFEINSKTLEQRPVLNMKTGITDMIYYKDHYLLAWSTKGYGVYDSNFKLSTFLNPEVQQMQDIRVTSWALGSEQILWCGTDGNGVIRISPKIKSFSTVTTSDNGMPYNKSVRAFCEENGNLWVGTKGSGIIKMRNFWSDGQQVLEKQSFLSPAELDNNSIYSLKKGSDDLIYIGTDAKGLGVYDLKSKKFQKWANIKEHDKYPEFGSIYAIFQDKDHSVWLGTSGYGLIHKFNFQ